MTNNKHSDEAAVKQALNQHFDAEVQNLNFTVTSKLSAARHRALAQQGALTQQETKPAWQALQKLQRKRFGWQHTAGGLATVAIALVVGNQMLNSPVNQVTPSASATASVDLMEDLTLLAGGDDIEFYQNIEFLEWLDRNTL